MKDDVFLAYEKQAEGLIADQRKLIELQRQTVTEYSELIAILILLLKEQLTR